MAGRLAVDFGTSNTVIAVWDETRQEASTLRIPDYGRVYVQGDEQIAVIPSLVHYTDDKRIWIGEQVVQQNLYHANQTFRWMKRYIINRSPIQKRINGRQISHAEAGRDFLSAVLVFAAQELNLGDEEIALTAPVEAFEHYENWLEEVAASVKMPRFRLIDEPSAAALGYGTHIQPGDVYLIFDFGGGTLHTAVVLVEEQEQESLQQRKFMERRCRVLGKAGIDLGGTSIDQWLFQEVLRRNQRSDADEDVRQVSAALLVECERLKEQLSRDEQASLNVVNPQTGAIFHAEINRAQFEEILDQHEAFTSIDRTIRRAMNLARERGYSEEHIKAVFMVGGSSQILSVQQTLRRIFGKERVMLSHPLDAIARGAAAFIAGIDFYDFIQHDYSIRFFNSKKGDYDYRVLVPRGTAYPTKEAVARLSVKATQEDQKQLRLEIYEMSEQHSRLSQRVELVFDPSGAARLSSITPDEEERRILFWMNEHQPTFLKAHPPASRGEARFEVEFNIDANKRLLITARDLKTGLFTHRDYPVVKLS